MEDGLQAPNRGNTPILELCTSPYISTVLEMRVNFAYRAGYKHQTRETKTKRNCRDLNSAPHHTNPLF
jgi:hypothetical protein